MLHACQSMLWNKVLPINHLGSLNPHAASALEEIGRSSTPGWGMPRQAGPGGTRDSRRSPQEHGGECIGVSAFAFQVCSFFAGRSTETWGLNPLESSLMCIR